MIESFEELKDTEYIVINEDNLRLPMNRETADAAIAFKFIQNPALITSEDELYDLLDLGKDLPVKFFFVKRVNQKGLFGKSAANKRLLSKQEKNDDRTEMSI